MDDDPHLRTLQVLDSIDRAERKQAWHNVVLRVKAAWPSLKLPPFRLGDVSGKLILTVLTLAVLIPVFYAHPAFLKQPFRALFGQDGNGKPLGVRVQPQGSGSLLVSWDAHSAAAQSAQKGEVEIDDGPEHRTLHLDSSQIANGSILYTPVSTDLMFLLRVSDSKGSATSESIRIVNPSNMGRAVSPPPVNKKAPSTRRQLSAEKSARGKPSDGGSSAKASSPSSLPNRNAATAKTGSAPNASTPAAQPRTAAAKAPVIAAAPKANTDRPLSSVNPDRSPSSAKYEPARPLKEVMPSAIGSAGIPSAVDVEVLVKIDSDGKVTDASVQRNTGANSFLTNAALTAAKGWTFEPAKSNGKDIPSSHTIRFRFNPQGPPS